MATHDIFMGTLIVTLDAAESILWGGYGQRGAQDRVAIKREVRRMGMRQCKAVVIVSPHGEHVATVVPSPDGETFDAELEAHRTRLAKRTH